MCGLVAASAAAEAFELAKGPRRTAPKASFFPSPEKKLLLSMLSGRD